MKKGICKDIPILAVWLVSLNDKKDFRVAVILGNKFIFLVTKILGSLMT